MLDYQLCFAIYAANNSVIRAYQRELKKIKLTYPQYLVLLVLWEVKNISVKHLANRLKLDPGSLSPILKRMQVAGLVLKVRKKEDERSVIVKSTLKADQLMPLISTIQKRVSCQTGLTSEEYISLRKSTVELLNNIDKNYKKENAFKIA